MLFSSFVFIWMFLPVVIGGNWILQKIGGNKAANVFLLIASIFFYSWGEPIYVFLMITSIVLNWGMGLLVSTGKHRKLALFTAVVLNISILGYFKYASMFIGLCNSLFQTGFALPKIELPIGISFFTFQALSYVIDVYRKECKPQHSLTKLALYISFFPQLIAGPIVKYKDIASQIDNRVNSRELVVQGIRRFTYGFAKKVLISNILATTVDKIYSLDISDVTSPMIWIASLMYTLQIYYDFSGYSDMAIGLGKIFGFDFKENFYYPYMSLSIREFWRRWHISLSSWFKEYVYIPLGGSRHGARITYENLIIVFFLTGLWHGAGWNFVFWGMLHGMMIILERIGLGRFLEKHKIISWVYTFLIVNFAWVFFRVDNIRQGFAYIKRMLLPWKYCNGNYSVFEFVSPYTIFIFLLGFIGIGFVQRIMQKRAICNRWIESAAEMVFCMVLFFVSIISLAGNTYNPFIYFRF